ncbi:TVP38/TMEM64 family protein [Mycobacterium sp. MYCO198283]|uniref:TVP38/TMEM64 family protein n=1 Tax=Mycobacterium sp. MYCO198283 TaxID=2883505 RepID=UPI001E5D54DA|nr:TVP38/TMEM64 family protein [Mycobacterium sp. MYCO198283]MCG5433542.1 TVP38/TMEM64 family protein [Mycobacterium sp. MYCO198283]
MKRSVSSAVRAVSSGLRTVARGTPPRRLAAIALAVVAVVAVAVVVPLPTALQLRDWATSVGPWFPVAFFLVHVAVTVFPVPRTAFTLAGGLLFGPLLGVTIAVAASTVSAVIALLAIRFAGWQFSRVANHPSLGSLDRWMSRRGWSAVLSLRLIAPVPFAVINYAAAASSVRLLPYVLATVAGLIPGTAAFVLLGDAVTGHVDPLLVAVSIAIGSVGVAILAHEVRAQRRRRAQTGAPAVTGARPAP